MKLKELVTQLDIDESFLLLPSNADKISIGNILKSLH